MKIRSPFPATQGNESGEQYEDDEDGEDDDETDPSSSTVIIPLGGKSRPLAYMPTKNYISNEVTNNSIDELEEIQDDNS